MYKQKIIGKMPPSLSSTQTNRIEIAYSKEKSLIIIEVGKGEKNAG